MTNSYLATADKPKAQMAPKREFIGWHQAIIATTIDRLFDRYAKSTTWDMRDLLIVLPSAMAKRRLQELLTLRAQTERKILYAPRIVTSGQLPEELYVAKFPFAGDLVQVLAWVAALQKANLVDLQQIVPQPPQKSASEQWLELGKMIAKVHRELASERMNFAKVVAAIPNHPEVGRWQALAKIQHLYLQHLNTLELWDIQTARLVALDNREAKAQYDILVIGAVDLNPTQRAFLEAVAEHVEIWVGAPASYAHAFDEFGCVSSEAWQDLELNLPEQNLLVGNSPTDQAELAAACLAELSDRWHCREVSLGVVDSTLVPTLQHQFGLCNVEARFGAGTPLSRSEPAVLLTLVGKFAEHRSFSSFAALVRHPAFGNVLRSQKVSVPDNWLALFDDYCQEVLPKTVDEFVLEKIDGSHVYQMVTQAALKWLNKLVGTRPQALSHWVQPLLGVLKAAYDRQMCDLEDTSQQTLYKAAQQVCSHIVNLRDIPAALEPRMTSGELIDWLLRAMSDSLVPEPASSTAIEILGWLELALDDAPVLIMTGIHDGVVPESVNADTFLPNQLRKALGMMDNTRRYARDMYYLQVILNAREHLRIIYGKTNHEGDPLVPSRLLLACKLGELPRRVLRMVSEEEVDVLPPVEQRWQPVIGTSRLIIPKPQDERPKQISVTAFRDYLQCPYRYYLRHVLKLREKDEVETELDAPKFGILLHDTLSMMARNPVSRSHDAEEVEAFLIAQLQTTALQKFGPNPPAGVLIQIEQAELRLRAFASKQAAQAADGWEVRFIEEEISLAHKLRISNLPLIGRIDRIDYHPERDQWAIWDYKSSEVAKKPVAAHWTKAKGWKDLQLPLYRHMANRLGVTGEPIVGYICLPKQARDCGFVVADFTPEQLQEADQLAEQTAARIVAGDFWPEKLEVLGFDDFGRICQTSTQTVAVAAPTRRQSGLHVDGSKTALVSQAVVDQAQAILMQPSLTNVVLPPLLIRASAGTGKTFQLSNRLLQIILSGQSVDNVLATTFTRKAAGEILQRVLQRLARACVNESSRSELAEHITGVDCSAAACLAALRRVASQLHRFRVSTLDSYFAQVARTFSLEMSLPPGWSALDPIRERTVQMQAIQEMLDHQDRKTLVNLVRMLAKGESQRQVAEQIRSTVNSGYGAYRVTDREAWDQIPIPAAPSEAATESALMCIEQTSLGNKNADRELGKLLLAGRTGDWDGLLAHGVYKNLSATQPTYYRTEIPPNVCTALEILRERAAAELLPIRRAQTLASYDVLDSYNERYLGIIRRQRSLSFSDVSFLLAQWMYSQSGPSKRSARLEHSNSFAQQRLSLRMDCGVNHLLLDEFQDTSPEQWNILRPLAQPIIETQNLQSSSNQLEADFEYTEPESFGATVRLAEGEKSFFCVGDTKQAIYGWRGGAAEIFDSVTSTSDRIEQRELSDSFRSSPEVIEVVNEVFRNLSQHSNFADCDGIAQQWSQRFPVHHTSRAELPGYVRLQNGPSFDKDTPSEERYLPFLKFTATQIAELTRKTSANIGVLFRRNQDVATMIGLLRDEGVSASQDGGNPLTDSAAVELLLSLVHLADHPGDGICAFHVGTSPLAEHLPANPRTDPTVVADWVRQLVARQGLGRTIESLADKFANELSWWDQHRLKQLVRSAYEFQASSASGRLSEFEESVVNQRISLPTESQVKVMTVHKSKGLEFDAVFLPDLDIDFAGNPPLLVVRGEDPCSQPDGVLRYMNENLQQMLPQSWQRAFAQTKERDVVESLCLLYVAMTRARQALYMTTHPTSGGKKQNFESMLQSVLAPSNEVGKSEAVLYEKGNATWYLDQPAIVNTVQQAVTPLAIRLRRDQDSAPKRSMRVAAPSSAGQAAEPVPLANAFSFNQSIGATFGTLIHAFFEQVVWLDDFKVNRQELRRIALAAVTPEELRHIKVDAAIDSFQDMLHLRSVRTALSATRYKKHIFGAIPDRVEIDNERTINLVMEDQLVSGTIDRLVLLMKDGRPYAAEIIDFKTDAYDPAMTLLWTQDRIEYHRPQLEIHRQVISELFELPKERVTTHLVLLSSDEFVRCDHVPTPAPHFQVDSATVRVGS